MAGRLSLRDFGWARLTVLMLCALAAALVGLASGDETLVAPAAKGGGQDVEVLAERSRTSKTFRQAEGGMRTELFAGSVHFRDAKGEWVPVDQRLTRRSDGKFEMAANAFDVEVPADATQPVRVVDGDSWVSFALEGASGGAAAKSDGVRFDDALEGVAVEYAGEADGLKETLVLADRQTSSSFSYSVQASEGLKLVERPDGSLSFEADGRQAFAFAAPVMWDSASPRAVSRRVRYTVAASGDGWRVGLVADRDWIEDAERVFPVMVDPTVAVNPSQDCYIVSTVPNGDYCPAGWLLAGKQSSGRVDRSLLKFDVSSIPQSAFVYSADLQLYNSAGPATSVDVHRVEESWTTNTSWNKRDGTTSWTTAGGQIGSVQDTNTSIGGGTGWEHFYITDVVEGWVNDSTTNPNHGVLLKATNESTTGSVEFHSSTGTNKPVLSVQWQHRLGMDPQATFDSFRISDRSDLHVNVANGNLVLHERDMVRAGVGLNVNVDRFYNYLSEEGGAVGAYWTLGTARDICLNVHDGGKTVTIHMPSSRIVRFKKHPTTSGAYISPAAVDADLEVDGMGWKLTFHRSREVWKFRADGMLTSQEDRNGQTMSFSFQSSSGRTPPGNITDTEGTTNAVSFPSPNTQGRITSMADPSGRSWSYGYSSYGGDPTKLLTSYTNPDLDTTYYEYTGTSLTKITDPRGNQTRIEYTSGRVSKVIRVTNTTAGTGPTTTYTYDIPNKKTTVTDPRGTATSSPTTDGQTLHYYDTKGQVEKTTNALGQDASTEYTANGNAKKFTGQGQTGSGITPAITNLTFDTAGGTNNFQSGTLASGETFSTNYKSGATGYDRYQPEQSIDAQGKNTWMDYDTVGNLTRVADQSSTGGTPLLQAALAYTDPTNDPSEPKGLLKSATDGNSNATLYEYFADGMLRFMKPPLVGTTRPGEIEFTYDSLNRVDRRTDEKGQWLENTYDTLDRVTRIDASDGAWMTFTYDNNGNMTARSDSQSQSSTFAFDELNRRTSETVVGNSVSYEYDANSNLTKLTDGAGDTLYAYDAINRIDTIDDPANSLVDYYFDDTGATRHKKLTLPDGRTIQTDYSLSGKVTKVEAKTSGGTSIRTLDYDYSPGTSEVMLRASEEERHATTLTEASKYAYDDVNRLCLASTGTISGTPACGSVPTGGTTYKYTFDGASNRLTKVVGSTTTKYGYDAANEMCWSTTGTATHNNCTPTPTGATSYTYDANGNRTDSSLSYDVYNRQSGIGGATMKFTSPDNTEQIADGTATLKNSLLGLDASVASGTTTYYIADPGGTIIGERTGTTTRYFVADALGSTRWVLKNADTATNVDRTYAYDPDGKDTATGPGADTRIRYAGGNVAGLGTSTILYHFGARFYDPVTARWTQADPLDQPSDLTGANRYGYAGGDPINSVDPSGTITESPNCRYRYGCGGDIIRTQNYLRWLAERRAKRISSLAGLSLACGAAGLATWEAPPVSIGFGVCSFAAGFADAASN